MLGNDRQVPHTWGEFGGFKTPDALRFDAPP
jgi:hypothetical protein